MVKSLIRDDRLPMHVNYVQLFILHVKMHVTKILIFAHVVIFYMENTTKKHISNIENGRVRATHQEHGQAIGSLQAHNLPKQVCDILYE